MQVKWKCSVLILQYIINVTTSVRRTSVQPTVGFNGFSGTEIRISHTKAPRPTVKPFKGYKSVKNLSVNNSIN